MDNVFVIGDVHGNLDRLEALLKQEGLLVRCPECDGAGSISEYCGAAAHENVCGCEVDCDECLGLGIARARKDVRVIQLGDLGDFSDGSSPTGDLLCYKYVTENRWCDVVLWGNHDRAMVDRQHAFTGFIPNYEAGHYIKILHSEGRMQTAIDAGEFLITHAGLASAFKHQKVDPKLKTDVQAFVDWINDEDDKYLEGAPRDLDISKMDANAAGAINAIGSRRGGSGPTGGILWRDIRENLFDGFRQIFGHSADHEKHMVRYVTKNTHTRDPNNAIGEIVDNTISYCIDIGAKRGEGGDCLAGIWLPSEKIVRVDLK